MSFQERIGDPSGSSAARANAHMQRAPFFITALLTVLTLGSVLPKTISAGIEFVALVSAAGATALIPRARRRSPSTTAWAWAILAYWFLLIFLPNIPNLNVGVLGFRKTAFCMVGLILAAAIPQMRLRAVEIVTVSILLSSLALSLILYLFYPSIEAALVDRDAADMYTGLFDGVSRLQGIFSGPFHVAIGALILLIWGVTRFPAYRLLALVSIVVGGLCLNLTNVRTAYVALALALLAVAFASPNASRAAKRLLALAGLVVLVLFAMIQWFPERMQFFTQIINFEDDTRFTGRFAGYSDGLDMISRSPLWGWGAGSAGDTLGVFFTSGEHVTSHNLLLKIATEGGMIGVVLWLALIVSILRHLPRGEETTSAGVGLLVALFGMGLTGSAVEGLPLTFILFFLVGLYLRPRLERKVSLPRVERRAIQRQQPDSTDDSRSTT